jgi:hypothetical protein
VSADTASQWERLVSYAVGFQAVWIIDIGLKQGLFEAIRAAPDGIGGAELAGAMGCDPRYVELWCRSAYVYELLDWDEHRGYRLAPETARLLLDAGDPLFMGGRIQFIAALHEDFRAYPEHLRTGATWPRSEHDPWLLEALKRSSTPDSRVWTTSVLPQAPAALERLERGGRLLDIGAGAGVALLHYAQRFPVAEIVGIELDEPSIDLARRLLADAGLTDRVEIRRGDANELDDAEAYDLVTTSSP